jgi:hypothetical protein
VVNSLFVGNEAFNNAGAIENLGGFFVINCTFLNNISHKRNCFWNLSQSAGYHNNIFVNNVVLDGNPLFELSGAGNFEISHCAFDAQDTIGLVKTGPNASLQFSLNDNLMGISPLLRADYRHSGCSALIDRGETVFLANLGISMDFGGNPRVLGDNVDIGAFETPRFHTTADWADAGCFGLANGSATLWTEGGIPPYSFLWDGLPHDSVRTDLPAGTHSAIVLDSDLCAETFDIEIGQPNPILLASTVVHSSNYQSFDGSVAVDSVWSGIPPFSFLWSTGSTANAITGLAPGPYTLSVTDMQGCMETWEFEVMSASGTTEAQSTNDFWFYPNPFLETLTFCSDSPAAVFSISLYDELGRRVWVERNARHRLVVQTGNLPLGLYFWAMETEGRIVQRGIALKQ